MNKTTLYSLCLSSALFVSGCGGKVGEVFGLGNSKPDEFAVVKRKSLSLPPDFALRPPSNTKRDSKIALTDTRHRAQSILFGAAPNTENTQAVTSFDIDDEQLLQLAGAQNALPNIREIVDQESTDLIRENRTFVKEILHVIIDPDPPGKILDPLASQREVNQQVLINNQKRKSSVEPIEKEGAKIIRKKDESSGFSNLWSF